MTQWVDFNLLRERLDFAAVLQHYGVQLKGKGDQRQGLCPLPSHPAKRDGQRRTPSFSANLVKGIWQCFGCGAKGNAIEFAALMEKLDPKNKDDFRKAALILQDRFGIATTPPDSAPMSAKEHAAPRHAKSGGEETKRSAAAKEIVVNAPLDFTLTNLDDEHPYLLRERRFTPETIERFGLGYCSRGLMKGRIAIPLHDADDKLIGYAGRIADEEPTGDECPKYLFPSSRERNGVVYEFRKSLFLYNGSAIDAPVGDLIVVEGFASVWWLWQNGYRNVVALMGSTCSPEQAALIVSMTGRLGRVWVFPDGDDAGTRCMASVFHNVAEYRLFRWIKLTDCRQPTDCSAAELDEWFGRTRRLPDRLDGILCARCGKPAVDSFEHRGEEENLCADCLVAAHDGSLFEP